MPTAGCLAWPNCTSHALILRFPRPGSRGIRGLHCLHRSSHHTLHLHYQGQMAWNSQICYCHRGTGCTTLGGD